MAGDGGTEVAVLVECSSCSASTRIRADPRRLLRCAHCGAELRDELVEQTQRGSPSARMDAASVLADSLLPEGIEALLLLMDEPDNSLANVAMVALVDAGTAGVADFLDRMSAF